VKERKDARVVTRPPDDTIHTPEQRRAADALRAVQALDNDVELRKRYRAYADRIGPTILMNGLGQALATERAAAGGDPKKPEGRAHDQLYKNLQNWLCRNGGIYELAAGGTDLLQAIVDHGEAEYLRAQTEALAWLVWHKKFCRAYLPASEPSDNEEG
jgi:CRISPR-associated protein Cmr5